MTSAQMDDLQYPYDRITLRAHSQHIDHILAPSQRRQPVWILAGKEGIGKSTAAFYLAARLLSQQSDPLFGDDTSAMIGDASEATAALIRAGSHPDFKYIHARGDTGSKAISTDQVREMSSFLAMTPSMSQWRVVIIDALDDININGANAMLKTLEEPPKNSMILLISHATGSILPTIRSRSRMLRMNTLNAQDTRDIIAMLYPDIEPDWLAIMVSIADGAPGRAVMMAETGCVDIYAESLTLFCQNTPDLLAVEHLANQWGLGGVRNRGRRHMAYVLFDRLLAKAVRTGQSSVTGSSVPLEQSALDHIRQRCAQIKLAEYHHQFLSEWREAEGLNLAMMPVMMRLFRALT